jgi:hypothetical protein
MKTASLVLAAFGVLQWLVYATRSAITREPFPKKGLRSSERSLLASCLLLAICWIPQVDPGKLWKGTPATAAASTVPVATSAGSCATIASGMTLAEVTKRMGPPDLTLPAEETRGPGATTLFYERSGCIVHVLDEHVELVD